MRRSGKEIGGSLNIILIMLDYWAEVSRRPVSGGGGASNRAAIGPYRIPKSRPRPLVRLISRPLKRAFEKSRPARISGAVWNIGAGRIRYRGPSPRNKSQPMGARPRRSSSILAGRSDARPSARQKSFPCSRGSAISAAIE
jgi:hypothetical protein